MQTRQLTRSETNKRLGGVAGGIGEYFGIDPILVRVGFVVGALMGFGVLLYIALWIVLPKGPAAQGPGGGPVGSGRVSPALQIAEERFARSEISAEQLAQIRADLTRSS